MVRGRGRQKRSFISAKFSWRIMARIQCTDANSRSCVECGAPFDYLDCTWPLEFVSKETKRTPWPGRPVAAPEQGDERERDRERSGGTEKRPSRVPAACTMDRSSIWGQAHYNLYDWSFGQASES